MIVTIDGTAGSGKGRIAKYISNKWGFKHLDSGILYRNLAYKILKSQIDIKSPSEIKKILKKQKNISFRKYTRLRTEKISKIASIIATHKFVRDYINKFQRNFVNFNKKNSDFVIDGRDIGSVVFRNAELKLYIDVSEQNRAKRRYKQLIDSGEKSIYRQILKDIKLRDKKDKNRSISPLVIPRGAFIINNNDNFTYTINQVNELMRNI